ncbi:hypothetical protein [Longitalea arenae]|uniref:hypothetical protein n=1 Tax=Longitalea arenae TaxID=2812558 RepID=UPI001966F415|nr:hypothetical protein [Longitalea arenae]
MHWFLFLILLIPAGLVFYQDLSSRSVLWYLFPLTAVLGFINSHLQTGSWKETLAYIFINSVFVLLQFVLLKLYFSLKNRDVTSKLINGKIGLGDLLFLLAACFFFSPFNFLLFYCSSLLFAISFHWLFNKVFKTNALAATVPLAGWMAIFLIVYIAFLQVTNNGLTKDDWILNYLLYT